MSRRLTRVVVAVLLGTCALAVSGCVIEGLSFFGGNPLGGYVDSSTGQGVLSARAFIEQCFQISQSGGLFTSCFAEFGPIFLVATLILVFGGEGALQNFLDPLIVQFPANVSNFSGTFAGAVSGALVIQSGLSCVNTAPGQQLCAETGQQLVVLDLPPGTPAGTYNFTLNFAVTPPGAIAVKPVIAGKVVVGGQTFFPLLVPCVTSFASVAAITIPTSSTAVGIPLNTSGVTACTGRTIDFSQVAARAIPTLSQSAYVVLAALIVLVAVYVLGMRRRTA